MKHYMQTMANVIDGSHVGAPQDADLTYFDAKYISVYRNNSVSAYIDVLRANYKSVAALVGEEFFSGICLEYIKAYPATRRTLVGYGEHFAQLIGDNLARHKLPYLASFAKLDRAWTVAHTARDAAPLDMTALEDIIREGGDIESFAMSLMPGASLISNDWPVFPIWAALREDVELTNVVDLMQLTENVLVWRSGYTVMYRDLSSAEFAFLQSVQGGSNLGFATVELLAVAPATNVGQLLAAMMSAKVLTNYNGDADA